VTIDVGAPPSASRGGFFRWVGIVRNGNAHYLIGAIDSVLRNLSFLFLIEWVVGLLLDLLSQFLDEKR